LADEAGRGLRFFLHFFVVPVLPLVVPVGEVDVLAPGAPPLGVVPVPARATVGPAAGMMPVVPVERVPVRAPVAVGAKVTSSRQLTDELTIGWSELPHGLPRLFD
jgi:hypothetical protein